MNVTGCELALQLKMDFNQLHFV